MGLVSRAFPAPGSLAVFMALVVMQVGLVMVHVLVAVLVLQCGGAHRWPVVCW
jgi:hypothetical protein